MIRRTDKERLLADVLGDESEAGFHEALLGETLRLARRRRRIRRARRMGGAMALMIAVAAVATWRTPRPQIALPSPPIRNYELTLSQPLSPVKIVTTRSLAADQLVSSTAIAGVIRTTRSTSIYNEVGDDELLALAPQPAALVRRGPHDAELVLVRPAVTETNAQQN